jgi:basic amino acid/polyamine antiporter, APA family
LILQLPLVEKDSQLHFEVVSKVSERVVRLEKKSLKRVLGVSDLFAIGYGDVGSSIYYALGATALYALGATPLALLAAGAVFICTALTYAEMATTFPEPGGSAAYSRHAFNDMISFVAGWGLLLDYIVTIAISAFAIPPYLKTAFQAVGIPYSGSPLIHCSLTIGIIVFLFFLNLFGVKESGRFSTILAAFTIITQAGIILMGGLLFLNLPSIYHHLLIGVQGADWSPDWAGFLKGCAMAMVAYTGIEAISQLAAEVKHPSLSIPRAIKWTTAVVLFLYIGLSTVGLSIISPQELGTRYLNDPVGGIAENFPIGGAILGPWVGLIAAIILLIASNAGLIGCSRLVFFMGEHYQVPSFCYKIHSRFRTPYITLIIFTVLSSLIVAISQGRMLFLADIYNFGAQIAFFSVHMSLLVLRWRRPELERPFRAPLNIPFGGKRSLPLTAIIGAIATLAVWLLVVATKFEGRIIGFSWMFLGLGMYFYYRKKHRISAVARTEIEKVKVPHFHPLKIRHILAPIRLAGSTEALQTACQLAKVNHADLTLVFVLEVPHSLPMDVKMPKMEGLAEAALKRAEAIARELNLTPNLKLLRSRSVESALLNLTEKNAFDLLVIGLEYNELKRRAGFGGEAEKLLKDSPCRVFFCRS